MNEDERTKALRAAGMVSALRWNGGCSEEEIATKAGFKSVEHMRWQLERWDLPEWLVRDDPVVEKPLPSSSPPLARRARGSGPAKQLPSAGNAAPLFREKLESLMRATEQLKHRKEKMQGGRFVQSSVHTAPVSFSPDFMSEEQWRYVSEVLGLGPEAAEAMHFGGATWSIGGGSATPAEPLPALIGAYLLAGGEVEPLVQALHLDPSSAEWEKIRKRIEDKKTPRTEDGIIAIAQQLATLIRGGEVKRGRNPAELQNHEISLASRITKLREQGWADEDIYRTLRQMTSTSTQELSRVEFQRLADLGQTFPWL